MSRMASVTKLKESACAALLLPGLVPGAAPMNEKPLGPPRPSVVGIDFRGAVGFSIAGAKFEFTKPPE